MGELLPCPFCGGDAEISTYQTESLWSHNQVEYTKIGCGDCDVFFCSEKGMEIEAPAAWNTRVQSTTLPLNTRVEKVGGSSWRGRIVGTYSTTLTPEGYCVESDNEPGSVQIYPVKALRRI